MRYNVWVWDDRRDKWVRIVMLDIDAATTLKNNLTKSGRRVKVRNPWEPEPLPILTVAQE